jgi:phage terminase large subunit
MELRGCLQPKQRQFAEAIDRYPVTFYGGAKGGGKSKGLQLIMLMRRFKYPGSSGGIFRRTYPELEGNHIRPLFQAFPELRPFYNESKKLLSFPNGSTLQFCHCNNEADVDLYQGREFHDLAIDEAGQWTEPMFRKLQGSNRSSNDGIKARSILTGNPGGIGHTWLKRLFVERRFNERERPSDYTFIQALVDDNAALIENDPEYVHRLESEPNQALRKAYRYGDWDIFAGQYFGEIRREKHFIDPITIPRHWPRFGAYDFGFNHPAAFGWFTVDEDGNVYLYRELVQAQLRVDQFAAKIKAFPDTANLDYIKAGHDCWTNKGVLKQGTPKTIAEEFSSHGITLTRATIDRIQGATQVRNYMAWQDLASGSTEPRFYIFNTCPISFDCLARMQHDPDRVEDVLKQDATEGDPNSGDDAYDMVRYGLMSRPFLPNPIKSKLDYGTAAWAKHESKRLEDNIQSQIEHQQAEERGEDLLSLSLMGMDENPIEYYLNKRRL